MLPFGNIPTRPFLPGAPGAAFFTLQLLPLLEVQGPGQLVRGQFAIESAPMVQAHGVAAAWDGQIAGQIVLQPLTDPTTMGP